VIGDEFSDSKSSDLPIQAAHFRESVRNSGEASLDTTRSNRKAEPPAMKRDTYTNDGNRNGQNEQIDALG
jgi:hypothetical protein